MTDLIDEAPPEDAGPEPPPAPNLIAQEAAHVLDRLRPPEPEPVHPAGPTPFEIAEEVCRQGNVDPHEAIHVDAALADRIRRCCDLELDQPITNLDRARFEAMATRAEAYWHDNLDRQAVREGWRDIRGFERPADLDRFNVWQAGRELFEPGYQRPQPIVGARTMAGFDEPGPSMGAVFDGAIKAAYRDLRNKPPGSSADPFDYLE